MQKVEIRVKGLIDEHWAHWFGDLTLTHTAQGETVLTGAVADPSTVYGLLTRLRDLGLALISANCVEMENGTV